MTNIARKKINIVSGGQKYKLDSKLLVEERQEERYLRGWCGWCGWCGGCPCVGALVGLLVGLCEGAFEGIADRVRVRVPSGAAPEHVDQADQAAHCTVNFRRSCS